MGRGTHWHHNRGFSPFMALLVLGVLLLVFSKGLFWPLLFLFGFIWWSKAGSRHSHSWGDWCESDEHEKRKNAAFDKRKNDAYFDEYDDKRKNDDVYYV